MSPPSDSQSAAAPDTVVLDIDGTLVDSVYAHVWSWREAFRTAGLDVATWRIHRAIGMGGDRLVTEVTHERVEASVGDELRRVQSAEYHRLSRHLVPTRGAQHLLSTLKTLGLRVALASSGARQDTEDAIALLGAGPWVDGWVSGDDAEQSKPDLEPVARAVAKVGGRHAVVVGDSVWDMDAAGRAGHPGVGVLTGGVSRAELLEAGAVEVFEDPRELVPWLEDLVTGPSRGRPGG